MYTIKYPLQVFNNRFLSSFTSKQFPNVVSLHLGSFNDPIKSRCLSRRQKVPLLLGNDGPLRSAAVRLLVAWADPRVLITKYQNVVVLLWYRHALFERFERVSSPFPFTSLFQISLSWFEENKSTNILDYLDQFVWLIYLFELISLYYF